jgi:hypothetical protein
VDRHSFDRYQLMKAHYPQLAAGPQEPAAPKEPAERVAPPSAPPARPAEDTRGLDELFSQLRETWPS